MIIRVHAADRVCRLELPDDVLAATLFSEISSRFGVSEGSLFLDRQFSKPFPLGSQQVVAEYLSSGVEIFLKTAKVEEMSTNAANYKTFEQFLKERQFDTFDLPLECSYDKMLKQKGVMQKLPPSLALAHQKYRHVDLLSFQNVDDVSSFFEYAQTHPSRIGFLVGYYLNDPHYPGPGCRAVLEALYEADDESFLDSEEGAQLAELLKALGLEIIGWTLALPPSDQKVSPELLMRTATLQARFTHSQHYTTYPVSKFVTMVLMPNADGTPDPFCFQLSDQAMVMWKYKLLTLEPPTRAKSKPRTRPLHQMRISDLEPLVKTSTCDRHLYVVGPAHDNELVPTILESGKDIQAFDPDWLIVRVAESRPKFVSPLLQRTDFLPINREHGMPGVEYAAAFVQQSDNVSSLNFLMFVQRLFDLPTALSFCEGARLRQPIDRGVLDTLRCMAAG